MLVSLDVGAAGFFAHSAKRQPDFLLLLVHLDDLEVVLLTRTRPSMPSSISMKAPKSVRLRTRPSTVEPTGYFSCSVSQGLVSSCFRPSEMRRSPGFTLITTASTSWPTLTSFEGCFIR